MSVDFIRETLMRKKKWEGSWGRLESHETRRQDYSKRRKEGKKVGCQRPGLVSLKTCGRAVKESLRQRGSSKDCVSPRNCLFCTSAAVGHWLGGAHEKGGLGANAPVDIRMK